MATAVGVVHLSPLIRQGLAELLTRQPDLKVIGLFHDGATVVKSPPEDGHILLYDLATAHHDGAGVLMELQRRLPRAKILMFNVRDDDQAIIECVRAGAAGCVLQDASLEDLLAAIRALASGKPPTSARIMTSLFNYVRSRQPNHEAPAITLTKREEQILELLGQAMSNKEIAQRLYLQPQTVKNYVHLLFQKLDVHDRLEMIRMVRGAKR